MSLLQECATRPVLMPAQYFEGYIALRHFFDDPTEFYEALRAQEADYQQEYFEQLHASDDHLLQAAVIAVPLGSAVKAGTAVLRLAGETGLVTRAVFRDKLQYLLRDEYQTAVELTLPDYGVVPPFPLENRRLMAALQHGSETPAAVTGVQAMLASEGFFGS